MSRRIVDLAFTPEELGGLLRSAIDGLPGDVEVLGVWTDNMARLFHILIESDTFTPIPDGEHALRRNLEKETRQVSRFRLPND